MARILKEKKAIVSYGDSPGFGNPREALKRSGFEDIGVKYSLTIGDFEKGRDIEFKGIAGKGFYIANACLDVDGIISLPKMKTHGLARITGAIKNQYGCISGLTKARLHVKYSNPTIFSKMLVDLNNYLKPRLFVMDGIMAMEGNGPRGGDPVKMNCIILSTDPVAVDATFCRMIDLDPSFVPTNRYGKETGLGDYDKIDYVGDPLESFVNKAFNVVRKPPINNSIIIPAFIRHLFFAKPVIDPKRCVKCGICVEACPVEGKALSFSKGKKEPPVYDYNKCIRCYCCQEMCPKKAIHVK
jgi:uncharacterized protein (DUF362 family)/NAD-dependent dihydropyrimidine dehydrogenase PreA subunit